MNKRAGYSTIEDGVNERYACRAWCIVIPITLFAGWAASYFGAVTAWRSAILAKSIVPAPAVAHYPYLSETASQRYQRCKSFDWQKACESISSAGARRLERMDVENDAVLREYPDIENDLLITDDPSVVYDESCLRVYRLDLRGTLTFPYHANQLLLAGGNQTMALFIQHGAMRDANHYFCSFRKLMLEQSFRKFSDILVIAPDFNYKDDPGVLPSDAVWNATKPWGDWRVGAGTYTHPQQLLT
jgi:hypothetical protein